MSLKAKIEAVIYASEEPVTLQQLAGLLGLEAQGELDAIAARQQQLDLPAEEVEARLEVGLEAAMPLGVSGPETKLAADGSVAAETSAEKRAARDRERRLREYLREIVDRLMAEYAPGERGLEIREVAGGFRMATKPEYHDAVRGFVKSLKPPLKLTLQALETLAVVAYKQPVTAPEVSEIRGVDSGGVLGSLMARKLVTTAGRKQVIGRPILYKTTKDFLLRFGLRDVQELPSIEEFEKMAGELTGQEEMAMPEQTPDSPESLETASAAEAEERVTHEDLAPGRLEAAPQADGSNVDLNETVSVHEARSTQPEEEGAPR